jgi:hypothetical protein
MMLYPVVLMLFARVKCASGRWCNHLLCGRAGTFYLSIRPSSSTCCGANREQSKDKAAAERMAAAAAAGVSAALRACVDADMHV